jgi:dihydroflavonol-4-reductase
MTVLITGASGHVGANLVRALVSQGRQVRCLVHLHSRAIEGLPVATVTGDLLDLDSLCLAFQGAEVVYHLAACISLSMNNYSDVEAINVIGTRNVIEACRRAGVRRLLHFSSIHALVQEPLSVPIDEKRPLSSSPKNSPYDRTKAIAEMEVRRSIEQGLDAVIIYPTAVLGPYDFEPSYLGEAILLMAKRKLPALVTGGFDWVDVRDVVAGAMMAEANAPSGSRYLLSGHWVSLCDIAAMVARITGTAASRFVCPLWLARIGAPAIKGISMLNGKRPLYTSFSLRTLKSNRHISHEKATRELGYQPRPFKKTLEDTLKWFAVNGQLDLPGKASDT